MLEAIGQNKEDKTQGKYVFQDNAVIYIGQKKVAKFSSEGIRWYEVREEEMFSEGKQIISVIPEKRDVFYVFYYDKNIKKSRACRIEIKS